MLHKMVVRNGEYVGILHIFHIGFDHTMDMCKGLRMCHLLFAKWGLLLGTYLNSNQLLCEDHGELESYRWDRAISGMLPYIALITNLFVGRMLAELSVLK